MARDGGEQISAEGKLLPSVPSFGVPVRVICLDTDGKYKRDEGTRDAMFEMKVTGLNGE
jgi:hypothetical protein